MKSWELENLDFDTPWIYELGPMRKDWCKHWNCEILFELIKNNSDWKSIITKFFGFYSIYITLSDFYYLSNFYASKFCNIIKTMFNKKFLLECAVLTSFILLLSPKYQIIIKNIIYDYLTSVSLFFYIFCILLYSMKGYRMKIAIKHYINFIIIKKK